MQIKGLARYAGPMKTLSVLTLGSSAGGGDWPPLVAASLALQQRGHQIRCFGDEPLAKALEGAGLALTAVPAGLDLPSAIQAWEVEHSENPDAPNPLLGWATSVLPSALELARSCKPDLLMCSDFTSLLGSLVREETGIPMCVVNATYYVGPGARRSLEDDFANPALSAGFSHLIQLGDLVLHATDEQFDPPPDEVPPNHYWTGTLIWEPIQPQPTWLDEPGEPWALMTLSSHRQAGEMDLARAAIEAMSNFPIRTLLTLADAHSEDALGIHNERVRVETFVPHSSVLDQAALCVAHAGHGIVAKALYFGVPMVLVPWDRDQPGVAARAEALGVARVVRRADLTPKSLADAIRTVLATPSYSDRARAHGARIRANDANARVCSLIEGFLGV